VTSDGLVDRLVQWWETVQERFAHITTLVINLDNGPENHSRRTRFMQRIVEFVHQDHGRVRVAYYPPYHRKYPPIERCWGLLENHWNGALLDSIEVVLAFTRTMDVERYPSGSRTGDHHISDGCEAGQGGDG
jgi:transposase